MSGTSQNCTPHVENDEVKISMEPLNSGGAHPIPPGSLEVDIPCVRIRMHTAMNEDHLSKGVADQLSAFCHIQPCILQALWIIGLEVVAPRRLRGCQGGSYYNVHQYDDE